MHLSQHLNFLAETRDWHFHGLTQLLLLLKTTLTFGCSVSLCSISASEQTRLPALLVMVHSELLAFGKGLNLCTENALGMQG